LGQAQRAGILDVQKSVMHYLSKALYFLSAIETNTSVKRRLLEDASNYREESIDLEKRLNPFSTWERGVLLNYLALLKAELAKIETDTQTKRARD